MWHGLIFVGRYRRGAKVPYPTAYAVDAWTIQPSDTKYDAETAKARYLFNCAQRAHGQFEEHYPIALSSLLIAGLQYPVTSAVLGVGWSVCRVLFARGYVNEAKERGNGRYQGIGYLLCEFGLVGLVGKMAFDLIVA